MYGCNTIRISVYKRLVKSLIAIYLVYYSKYTNMKNIIWYKALQRRQDKNNRTYIS